MTYRIAILEKVNREGINFYLSDLIVDDLTDLPLRKVLDIIENYEVIIIKSRTNINKEFFDHAKNLKIIARAGIGLENINIDIAKENNIHILSTPGANSISTAEFTVSIMLSLIKNLPEAFKRVEEYDFRRHLVEGREISELTIGIIGLGRVGSNVARILSSFNCKTLGYDSSSNDLSLVKNYGVRIFEDLDQVLAKSDIITIHLPLRKEYLGKINKDKLSLMKKGSIIINTSRGPIIEEDSLLSLLDSGHISKAALDVITDEPVFDYNVKVNAHTKKLLEHPSVFYTPHMAASTIDAQRRISHELAQKIHELMKTIKNN
ncbi:NAD(P)-binding domain-containing protein [Alphaproteobacteria bacterium]|nr:NAD(P)-binding domain-containing protein [Alphaproteobacteria bacterium]